MSVTIIGGGTYSTIQDAINNAGPGDTIEIGAGTYPENVLIAIDGLTIRNAPGEQVIVNGTGGGFTGVFQVADGISVTMESDATANFVVNAASGQQAALYLVSDNDGSSATNITFNANGQNAVLTGGGQDGLTFTGNEFGGTATQLVYVNGEASLGAGNASTNVSFVNNTFSGDASGPLLGAEPAGGDITGNTFSGDSPYALLELWGTGNTIEDNTFTGDGPAVVDGSSTYDLEALAASNNGLVYIDGEPGFYSSIQAAIDASDTGDVIVVGPGTYDEDLNIHTGVTIQGAGAGLAGTDGGRNTDGTGETTLIGRHNITAGDAATIDGVRFLNNATTTGGGPSNPILRISSGENHTVTNSIFYSEVAGGARPNPDDRAISSPPLADGEITISNNYFTGDFTGAFSTASWGRAVWFDGGGVDINVTGNTIEYARSGLNFDMSGDSEALIDGNTFQTNGTALALGVDSDGVTFSNNTFENVNEEVNLRNLADGQEVDLNDFGVTVVPSGADNHFVVLGGQGDDELSGSDATNDILDGNQLNPSATDEDELDGEGGNDILIGRGGDDFLDGGDGIDTAVFAGQHEDYTFTDSPTTDTEFNGTVQSSGGEFDVVSNVEVLRFADGFQILPGMSIQAAIDAAQPGSTIYIAEGTYAENLTIGKGITLVGEGNVTISPASGTPITISGDLGGANVTLDNLDIVGTSAGNGVFVQDNANVGTLTLNASSISGAGNYALFVYNEDLNTTPSAANLVVTDTDFSNNGYSGNPSGPAHIKLFGFTGDATIQNVNITGGSGVNLTVPGQVATLPDYGIEITGVPNAHIGTVVPTPPMGNVTIEDVTVTGQFHKNVVAVWNFGDVDNLSIDTLDLANTETSWGPVLNFEGITDSYDASAFDVSLPSGSIATELQGDLPAQNDTDQTIVGTDADDRMMGKTGNDTLQGGDGDDELFGHDKPGGNSVADTGNDTLEGGAGDDLLDGGAGVDTAVYNVTLGDNDVFYSGVENSWVVNAGAEGTDEVAVERVEHAGGTVLLVGHGGYATIQEAIDAATGGETILVGPGTYAESLTVDVDVTLRGMEGAILQGPLAGQLGYAPGQLDEHMEANHSGYSASHGFNVTAANVSISGFTVVDFAVAVLLNDGANNVSVTNNAFSDNIRAVGNSTYADNLADNITGFTFSDNNVSNGVHGVVMTGHPSGSFDTIVMNDNTFSALSEKGMYFENLSNATFDTNSFTDVGNYGRIAPPFGPAFQNGEYGQAIDINLKWQTYQNVTFTDTNITNSGNSNGGTTPGVFGAAIGVKTRDDGSYAGDPADFTGAITFDGLTIDGTSTGIRVGEPGKNNLGPDVQINDLTISNATVSDVENATHATNGGTVTVELADGQVALDASNSQADVNVVGNAEDNTVTTGSGNDDIDGGAGEDTLNGGDGDDMLTGGADGDTLDGGAGVDTAVYATTLQPGDVEFDDLTDTWTVDAGAEGTDTVAVEKLDHGDTEDVLLVGGNGGYATIQEAIDAADANDTILIAAGTYNESLTINKEGLTLQGVGGAVIIEGNIKDTLSVASVPVTVPPGVLLNDFFEANHPAYGGSTGITIGADNVSLSGLTLTGFGTGVSLGTSTGVSITGNTFTENVTGIRKSEAGEVNGLTVTGNTFQHSIHGITVYADAGGAGSLDGATLDNNTFTHLTEKGMYFEQLSNSTATGNTFTDVGNYGRVSPPFGSTDGEFGQAIDINLKYGTYENVTFNDTTITNSGHSDKEGAGSPGAFGAAIGVKTRDDGSYSGNPAEFTGSIVFNDLTIDGTSTGVRVGEPGKNNLGPDVQINDLTISNATVGDIDNATHATNGGTVTVELADGQVALDASNSQAPVTILGNGENNDLTGGSGDDTLYGNAGDDDLDGGDGIDTAAYNGDLSADDFTVSGGQWTVNANTLVQSGGIDTLTDVEVIDDDGSNILLVGEGGFDTIQEAVDAAADGDTILVASGDFAGNVTITNKELTILGANHGLEGTDGTRGDETAIVGRVTVTGSKNVTFDGLEFRATSGTGTTGPSNPALKLQGSGDYTVTNSVFFNETAGGATDARAISLDTSVSGDVTVDGNLFTGDSAGKYSTASWGRGVWSDGTSPALTITDNTFTNVRTGMNLDGYDDADGSGNETNVSGNTFDVVGTGISVGIPSGSTYNGIANNTFNDADTDFNFQNVTDPVVIDLDGSGNESTPGNATVILGGQDADDITGTDGNDVIVGNGGADTLAGGEGEDTLNGGAGADTLEGGDGDDTYHADSADTVVEDANEGTDEVISSESIVLADNVENLTLTDPASNTEDFEDFSLGPIANGENGWKFAGTVDQEVIDESGNNVFRMSSDPTTGAFGGPYSPSLSKTAGEPGTTADYDSMRITFDFKAFAPEDNSRLEVDFGVENSTDRNNFMVIENIEGSGLRIAVADPLLDGKWDTGNGTFDNFTAFTGNRTLIDGIDASAAHNLTMVVRFVDGADNDVIDFYLDDVHIGSSTTFENYRDSLGGTHGANAEANQVANLFFRSSAGGGATQDGPGGENQGFTFDNIQYSVFDSGTGPSGTGNALANTITGNSKDNALSGLDGNDTLAGNGGDDTLEGGKGDDTIAGADGEDTAVFTGDWIDYTITKGSFIVTDEVADRDGTDTVTGVEKFQFANGTFDADDILNDAPADINITADNVVENAANGTVVGTLSAVDADVALGDTATFTLLDDAGGRFELVGNNIVVKDGSLLDFETNEEHEITVKVTDNAGTTYEEKITIEVDNAPPALKGEFDFGPVAENGKLVGSVVGTGGDEGLVNYAIVPNLDGALFEIDQDGNLSFKANPDFENPADIGGDNTYEVTVIAADNAGSIVSQKYSIDVTNVNPGAVTDTDGDANEVNEGAANGTVVQLDVDATDGAGPTVYSLTDDAGGRFQIDANTGVVTVKNGSLLDFETATSHDITVRAEDEAGGNFSDQLFTINLNNVDGNTIIGTSKGDTINQSVGPNNTTAPTKLATIEGDTISGANGNDNITGLAGDDEINGGAGGDNIDGGDGNDTLTGSSGKDTILAGDGNDIIRISGGGDSTDIIDGGAGDDTLEVLGKGSVILRNLNAGDIASIEKWDGNGQALLGDKFDNTFNLAAMLAVAGLKYIDGSTGDDTITGSSKDDDLRGGSGNDALAGGAGNDLLTGNSGTDTVDGGAGDDTIQVFGGGDAFDTLLGGADTDTIKVLGAGALVLKTFDADAQGIEKWSGNNQGLTGTNDDNTFDLSGLVEMTKLKYVDGGKGDDTITGSDFDNDLRGGDGNDTVTGGGGNDFVHGGTGDDTLNGGGGNDILTGSTGKDTVDGGAGDDTIRVFGSGDAEDTLLGGADTDTLQVIGKTSLTLEGFDADGQLIEKWQGNNQGVYGNGDNNAFDFSGLTSMTGVKFVDGAGGDDTIVGSDFVDNLRGNTGNDTLDGGAGNDFLNGGTGVDTFVFKTGNDTDRVTGYEAGIDKFDLSETGVVNYAALQMSEVGKNVEIDFGGGDMLIIHNTTKDILDQHQSDFTFV